MRKQRRKNTDKKNEKRKEKIKIYGLLGFISVMLVIILYLLNNPVGGTSNETADSGNNNTAVSGHDSSHDIGDESSGDDDPVPPVEAKYKLYLVIDDVGNDTIYKKFLDFPGEITFAVMPQRTFSTSAAQNIRKAGKEYIIHQPMEALNKASNPGAGAIYSGMNKNEIYEIMSENMRSVPYAKGINNHMGSRVTSDSETLAHVFDFLSDKKMFFLDSMTMLPDDRYVGANLAGLFSLPYAQRNSMFIDNEKERTAMLRMINQGKQTAVNKGHAVMIGHATTSELADILIELYPELLEEGYAFHNISDLFEDE